MTLPFSSSRSKDGKERIKVLLLGYGHLGIALLRGLLASDTCEVIGVFRWSGRPASRSYWDAVEKDFATLIRNNGIQEVQCSGVNSYDFVNLVQRLKPDVLLIGSWGEILKSHILNLPDLMVINCHPSLLPAHRGANPYASVLLAQEAETGVSFHQVTEKIDAGPVLLQKNLSVDEDDTGGSLRDKCAEVAEILVNELMDRLQRHLRDGQPLEVAVQPEGPHPYYPQLKLEDGLIDWNKPPAALSAQFRALNPWVACYSFLENRVLVLLQQARLGAAEVSMQGVAPGTIVHQHGGHFSVATADPTRWLYVSGYRICWGPGYFPPVLSRLLGCFLFKPGRRFGSQS